jgi:hypothetical protein
VALQRSDLVPEIVETLPITPYLRPLRRASPPHVVARVKAWVWLRTPRAHHPHGHELLRALARRPLGRAK